MCSYRNLMNRERTITAEIRESASSRKPTTHNNCHSSGLLPPQKVHPASTIKHGDVSPYICQNCDATFRVLTQTVIVELKVHVPGSKGTQLYLQVAVWMHAPYRNDKFGPPPAIVRSLWAGIMMWWHWRQYVVLTPSLFPHKRLY